MTKRKLAILISGRGSNMDALLAACANDGFPAEPALVLSNRPDAAGLAIARTQGVATMVIDHTEYAERSDFDAAIDKSLRQHDVDLICLAGFMRILGHEFVSLWPDQILNIHPSLLPLYPGLDTHQRAIDDGAKIAGCTVHIVRPELDDGPIIAQAAVPVLADDTAQTLAARVLAWEHRIYPKALEMIAGGNVTIIGKRVLAGKEAPPAEGFMSPA